MDKRSLVVSSDNKHKIEEIKGILEGLSINILSKSDVGLKDIDIIEDGITLEENAIKKAVEISKLTDGIILADDTGLFVDALNGEPGVYSARYAGDNADDSDNNQKLLRKLEGIPMEKRTAKFKTVIALVLEDGKVITVTGECVGKIGFERSGENGFGYDPLFIVDGYNKTFGELGEEVKNKISHRANALNKLRVELENTLRDDMIEDSSNK